MDSLNDHPQSHDGSHSLQLPNVRFWSSALQHFYPMHDDTTLLHRHYCILHHEGGGNLLALVLLVCCQLFGSAYDN